MDLPKEPSVNEPLSADWGRKVVRAIRANVFLGGPGLLTKRGTNGTTASVIPTKAGGGGVSSVEPKEWTVRIENNQAIASPRPIVWGPRRIPADWDIYDEGDWYSTPPDDIAVNLIVDDVGVGDGFVFVEIDLDADTVTLKHSTARPVDDLANSIVRWPLVHVHQVETEVDEVITYQFSIDNTLHTGQIKILTLFTP